MAEGWMVADIFLDRSSTEPPDSTVAKKRAEAIEALTKIEIEFAQIRDLLFLEKMEELARERWQIEAGEPDQTCL